MAAVNISLSSSVQPSRDIGATTRRYMPAYTGATSYATGGDTGLLAALGVGQIVTVLGTLSNGTALIMVKYVHSTEKLLMFSLATGAEVANAVDLSTYTGVLEVIAR